MSRIAPHQDDDEPAIRRARVFEECAQDSRGRGSRGLEAESGYAQWKRKVVVDRLRDVCNAESIARCFRHGLRRKAGIITADRDQMVDAESLESVDDPLEIAWIASRIGARCAQDRATLFVDAGNGFGVEFDDVVDVALHEPFEALKDADDACTGLPSRELVPVACRLLGVAGVRKVQASFLSAEGTVLAEVTLSV